MLRILRPWFARLLTLAAIALVSPSVNAGPGHDHGPESAATAGLSSPRLVAVSEAYELVGILTDGKLSVYLDRLADTSPVTQAHLELIIGGETAVPQASPDGTFEVTSPVFGQEGDHEVIVTVAEGARSDLLIGKLSIPREDHPDDDHEDDRENSDRLAGKTGQSGPRLPGLIANGVESIGLSPAVIERKLQSVPLMAGFALAFGILAGAIVRGRTGLMISIFGLVALFGAGAAWAGPGHDHGEGGTSAALGDAPRRLPDGELFLPKPTQRLLAIRTRILQLETARSADRLIGRIIADPNRSGLVQSTIGGRVIAVAAGLPALGQQVKKGQVLALVEPAFAPIDASDVRQTAGDLAQRIAVLDARIARQQRLVNRGVVNAASLEDLQIERQGLQARRKELSKASLEPEELVAPVDGVIADVGVVGGQVVASSDTLFHVVDPDSLWVEAISFDPRIDPAGTSAQARTSDGELFDLVFVGRSRALQQQATVIQFRVAQPSDALNIGSPVKVLIEKGDAVTGLIVPRRAIAQAPNGQMVAFKRLEPERYLPAAVSLRELDGERVQITAGLKPGDQIIIEGAPLVNQIR